MATPNPFDRFDGANPFDAFDAPGEKRPSRLRAALSAASDLVSALPDQLQTSLDTIGDAAASGPPRRNRGAPQLPEVVVNARRVVEPGWGELAGEIPTQIGAQTVKRVAGAREYVGDTRNAAAKKELWQSVFLPSAVREAKQRGVALIEHPDVIEQARRLGIRPDVFARDWPKYANLSADKLVAIQTKARERIASSEEQRQAGAALRREAGDVARLYRPDLKEWSPKGLAFDAAVSIPDLLVAVGAGTAGGPVAGVGALMAGVAPGFYAEGKDMGLDGPRAEAYAALMTLAEGVPEVPVIRALSPAGRNAVRGSLAKLVGRATGNMAKVAGLEGLSEVVTESLQIGIEHGLLDQITPLPEALSRIARAGTIGLGVGAGVRGVTATGEAAGAAARRFAQRPSPRQPGLGPEEFVTETEAIYANPFDAFDAPAVARGQAEPSAVSDPFAPDVAVARPMAERLADPSIRDELARMRVETGWLETGGRVIRDEETGQVTGRTTWVPRAEWWRERPKGLTEAQAQSAIDKALAGQPLTVRETRLIDFMAEVAETRRAIDPFLPTAQELADVGLSEGVDDAFEMALVAQATETDPAAVERAAIQYENDSNGFLSEVRRIVQQGSGLGAGREEGARTQEARGAGQATEATAQAVGDLFGGRTATQQQIFDAQQERARREREAPPVGEGPGTLFTDAGRQIDVEDVRDASQAQPAVPGYTVLETPLDDEQAKTFSRTRPDVPAEEDVYRTVGGSRPSREWIEADGRAGAVDARQPFYRGSRGPLTPEKFSKEALGKASSHPTSGLGVFFSNTREDATRYGEHVEEVYLDLRNPRVVPVEELPGFNSLDDAFAWREQIRKQGHDGLIIDASHLDGPVWSVAFTPDQVIREQRNEFDQFDTEIQAARVQGVPGAQYVPMLQVQPPQQRDTITVAAGTKHERTIKVPKEPMRRAQIYREFERLFGFKIFQGRPFKGRMLGFFRPGTGEVRVRKWQDLEVAAHEVFHALERHYPSIRKLYHEARFSDELKGVSYDETKIFEGFAEFGRLLLTQADKAAVKAPTFYAAFMEEAGKLGILKDVLRIQELMHAWYHQGAEGRARSKIGTASPSMRMRWNEWTNGLLDRSIQKTFDVLQAFKVVERDVTGTIGDATVSPYKSGRLVQGARGLAKAVINHGTVAWNAGGDIVFTGNGLRQIFEPVADVLDDAMAYFAGRRAAELYSQGRESLFERDEIAALLDIVNRSQKGPEIRRAFEEYQAFLDRMLNFYEQSGLISGRTRAIMREMNKDYVPFNRLIETLEDGQIGKPGSGFRRLRGGTQNVRDIFENITLSVQSLTAASLHNHTKQQLYGMIERTRAGARYAVRVPAETHATRIDPKWLLDKLNEFIDDNELATRAAEAIAQHPAFGEVLLYWSGRYAPTAPDIDMVLVNGEAQYFQIGDPLLMDALASFNTIKPVPIALAILGGFSNVMRRGVTIALDFQIPNLIRDSLHAATMSKGGQIPLIDSIRGMGARFAHDPAYYEFLANGGGFSSLMHGEAKPLRKRLDRIYLGHKINLRRVLDTPRKVWDAWDELVSLFEYGTRLAEFRRMRQKGATLREAAYQGREISTDFAMRGSSNLLRWCTTSVPFLNARIESHYRLLREVYERDGRMAFNPTQTKRFALRAVTYVTIPSLALWWLNHDDERYKALPNWVRDNHWVILGPGDVVFLIPKPYEVGLFFGSVPERMLEEMASGPDHDLAEAIGRIAATSFLVDPTPQAIKPAKDIWRNQSWTGAPIVPEALRDVAPSEQFTPFTSELMLRVGRELNMSPAKLEYGMRGYFGTLGMYVMGATDALLDPSLETGPEPTGKFGDEFVIRRFVRRSPYHGTAAEEDFYKLLEQTRETVATFRKIEKDQRFREVEEYLSDPEKRVLLAISGRSGGEGMEQIAKRATEINALMRKVRTSPDMTAGEKRDELDQLQAEKNALFDAVSTVFSRAQIELLIEGE